MMDSFKKIRFITMALAILSVVYIFVITNGDSYYYGVINVSPNEGMYVTLFDRNGSFIKTKRTNISGISKEWDECIQSDVNSYYIINTEFNKLTGKLIQIGKNSLDIKNIQLPVVFSFFDINDEEIFCGSLGLGYTDIFVVDTKKHRCVYKCNLNYNISPETIKYYGKRIFLERRMSPI